MKNSIKRAYKYRFYPQRDLISLLANTFGCVRFVYNQTLKYSEQHYLTKYHKVVDDFGNLILIKNEAFKSLSSIDRINYIKTLKNNPDYSWLKDVSSIALQQSVMHLNSSYERFFKGLSNKPQFKKKCNRNSFTITGKNSLHFDKHFSHNKHFYLPKYNKPLNIKWGKGKSLRHFNHLAVTSVTISQEPSGKYFISFLVNEELNVKLVENNANNPQQQTSYDLGLKTTAKVYDGIEFKDFNLPELIKHIDNKLRKEQRVLSRKQKGSKNRQKQRIKVARLHEKKNNVLSNYYHKLSTQIINENQGIIREDLAVSHMLKNRKLSHAIHSVAWSKFNRMIDYKAQWHNRNIIEANRFYPSSKTCSNCGHINHGLKLSHRTWTCPGCNAHHDRDENACINLFNYNNIDVNVKSSTDSNTAVGTTVAACGGNVRPKSSKKLVSKKTRAVSCETGISALSPEINCLSSLIEAIQS